MADRNRVSEVMAKYSTAAHKMLYSYYAMMERKEAKACRLAGKRISLVSRSLKRYYSISSRPTPARSAVVSAE